MLMPEKKYVVFRYHGKNRERGTSFHSGFGLNFSDVKSKIKKLLSKLFVKKISDLLE
jgi:hypothetical protein